MKKSILKKLSDFFKSLANIRLVDWMSGFGLFIGFPFVSVLLNLLWKQQNEYALLYNIIITLIVVVFSVLYIASAVALSRKANEEKDRYPSMENYLTYKKFAGWRIGSYEEFIVAASNKYVESIFEDHMNCGIACAIVDFMVDNDNINSLYSIRLFRYYIRQHWEKYENHEVVLDCFLLPFNGLSMTPFSKDNKFSCNYDREFLSYLKTNNPELCAMNKETFKDIVLELKYPYRNDEFNIGFRCPEGFDYWRYSSEKDLPIFVKVRGNLTLDTYSNSLVIGNCRFDDQNYERYIAKLNEKRQEWKRQKAIQ